MHPINLDANASTPVDPEVWEAMRPWMMEHAGNPASGHSLGRRARRGLEDARETVARLLDAEPGEVVFTSGATEANNLAIFGLVGATPGAVALSMIEHPSVVEPVNQLARRGFEQLWLPVSHTGMVELPASAWPQDLRLVCVMLANHEVGTIQPVEAIARSLPATAALHCDAAAGAGKVPISFRTLGAHTLTISAHKFHGPKGIGALLVRKGTRLAPQLFGGHQQQGVRPGTEPVALAVGLACALELACRRQSEECLHIQRLRDVFLGHLRAHGGPIVVMGAEDGLPHTLNVAFPGCAADVLLMNFDLAGVACSTGSACSSGSLLPSPVLRAMSAPPEILRSAMRFSFSSRMHVADVEEAARRITMSVNKLRS